MIVLLVIVQLLIKQVNMVVIIVIIIAVIVNDPDDREASSRPPNIPKPSWPAENGCQPPRRHFPAGPLGPDSAPKRNGPCGRQRLLPFGCLNPGTGQWPKAPKTQGFLWPQRQRREN